MLTYEYQCDSCGRVFPQRRPISGDPLAECPQCGAPVRQLVTGGLGFHVRGSSPALPGRGGCSLESRGVTCCGRSERCGRPPGGEAE